MAILPLYTSGDILMTEEQKVMLQHVPQRVEQKKPLITKKRALITAGVVAAGIGLYVVGPKLVNKVQAYRIARTCASMI